jgi:hypothetical protein
VLDPHDPLRVQDANGPAQRQPADVELGGEGGLRRKGGVLRELSVRDAVEQAFSRLCHASAAHGASSIHQTSGVSPTARFLEPPRAPLP